MPTIDPRFNGPPASGNGGYTCGLVAGAARRACRGHAPPPAAARDAARVGRRAPARRARRSWPRAAGPTSTSSRPCPWPSPRQAEAVSHRYPGFERHAFPTCFVCGPERQDGDGLRIFAAPVEARDVVAAPWIPHEVSGGARLGRARLPRGDRRRLGRARRLRPGADGGRGAGAAARRRAVRRRRAAARGGRAEALCRDGALRRGRTAPRSRAADLDHTAHVSTRLAATLAIPIVGLLFLLGGHCLPDGRGQHSPVPGSGLPGVGAGEARRRDSCRPTTGSATVRRSSRCAGARARRPRSCSRPRTGSSSPTAYKRTSNSLLLSRFRAVNESRSDPRPGSGRPAPRARPPGRARRGGSGRRAASRGRDPVFVISARVGCRRR